MRFVRTLILTSLLVGALDGNTTPSGCGEQPANFTVVLLPDTQYYSEEPDNSANPYYQQAQWIVANRDAYNVKLVIHLGDMTDNSAASEWNIADKAHAILDDAGVPYTAMPGNHDYPRDSGKVTRDATNFNTWFGPDRFEGRPGYGGHYKDGNENNYVFFEEGDLEFMVLSLEFAPRKEVLCWAEDLISTYAQKRVIIVTHCYQTHGGGHCTTCATDTDVVGSNGDAVWDELASRHSNVFMVLSGHITDSEHKIRTGNTGNTVHEILTDYQNEEPCPTEPCEGHCDSSASLGNGWLRTLEFRPAENQVYVSSHSVEEGSTKFFVNGVPWFHCDNYSGDPSSPDHAFYVDYDMSAPLGPYAYEDHDSDVFSGQTINSVASGQQEIPDIAMSPGGDFVVAWEDDSDKNGDFQIMARGFSRGGCGAIPDFTVNSTETGKMSKPVVGMDWSGNFVVAWEDDRDGNGMYQIHARGFRPDGTERFSDRAVNSVDTGQQFSPAIAMDAGGDIVVVWEDDQDKNGLYQIYARGFYADGTQRFPDMQVNVSGDGTHLHPTVGIDLEGNFVVAWEDDHDGNGLYQIYARGFDAQGHVLIPEMTVNSVATGQQLSPALAMDSIGNFVVVWEDDQDENGSYQIYARGFDSNGAARLSDFTVNSVSTGQQRSPVIAMDPAGNFVVAWEDDQGDDGYYQLYARGFSASGAERFSDLVVNQESAGQQIAPSLAADEDGGFVVVWQDDIDGNGTFQILGRGMNL